MMAFIKYARTHLPVDMVMNFITNINPLFNKGRGANIYENPFYAMQLYFCIFSRNNIFPLIISN